MKDKFVEVVFNTMLAMTLIGALVLTGSGLILTFKFAARVIHEQ